MFLHFFLLIPVNSLAAPPAEHGFRILGGENARVGELPHQVSLRRTSSNLHFCGGSVLNKSFVITAAHSGQVQLQLQPNSVRRNVKLIVKHPRFRYKLGQHDLALLQLDEELPASRLIKPIKLNDKELDTVSVCTCSGWGAVNYDNDRSRSIQFTEYLQKAYFRIITEEICKEEFTRKRVHFFNFNENIFCAQGVVGDDGQPVDSCEGDSGGPLVCNGLLTGIVSTGRGCGSLPAIYTNVKKYLPWIQFRRDDVASSESVFEPEEEEPSFGSESEVSGRSEVGFSPANLTSSAIRACNNYYYLIIIVIGIEI